MNLVLDASIALAWCYEDETTEAVQRSFDIVRTNGAWVPVLWLWEVANRVDECSLRARYQNSVRRIIATTPRPADD